MAYYVTGGKSGRYLILSEAGITVTAVKTASIRGSKTATESITCAT